LTTAHQQLQTQLTEHIEEVIKLRFNFTIPTYDTDVVEVHTAVINVGIVLSQIESFLSKAIRAKAASDRKVTVFKMQYQEKWDRAIVKVNSRPTLSEYATGKEKAAEANLATLNEARQLRVEEELQAFAAEAVDVIRLHYYGLDKVRQDLRKRLDFESNVAYS
jgi:hypothetical protein